MCSALALTGMGWFWKLWQDAKAENGQLHRRVRRLLREYALVVDNELVGTARLRERTVIWHNRALARMFGHPAGALVGESSQVFYPSVGAFEELGRRAYPVLRDGKTFRTVVQLQRRDGALMWVDMSGTALDDECRDTLWLLLDITELKQHNERMASLAFHDALTGLPNRRMLFDRLERSLAQIAGRDTLLAVAYLDLNGFKPINDRHGHEAGDHLLKTVAQRLQASVRGGDTAARLGGDEFVLLLQVEDIDEARRILRRALRAIALPVSLPQGGVVSVGGSAGVAVSPWHGSRPEALLALADRAMYEAKREGVGHVCVFDTHRLRVPSQFGDLL